MTIREMIAVLEAAEQGKSIQTRGADDIVWLDCKAPRWDFAHYDYRVKPAPVEGWINLYADGGTSGMRATKESADKSAQKHRLRCIHVREVEE